MDACELIEALRLLDETKPVIVLLGHAETVDVVAVEENEDNIVLRVTPEK